MSSISANVVRSGLPQLQNLTHSKIGGFNVIKPTRSGSNDPATDVTRTNADRAQFVARHQRRGHNAAPVRHPQASLRIAPAKLNDTVDPNEQFTPVGANIVKSNGLPYVPATGANTDGARSAYVKAQQASLPHPEPVSTIDPNTTFDGAQPHAGLDTTA